MKIGNFNHAKFVSFPRKRESMIGREMDMDTRLRGYDIQNYRF